VGEKNQEFVNLRYDFNVLEPFARYSAGLEEFDKKNIDEINGPTDIEINESNIQEAMEMLEEKLDQQNEKAKRKANRKLLEYVSDPSVSYSFSTRENHEVYGVIIRAKTWPEEPDYTVVDMADDAQAVVSVMVPTRTFLAGAFGLGELSFATSSEEQASEDNIDIKGIY